MRTIDNDISTGQVKRAYLLYGEERYLIRQYRDKLKHALVDTSDTMNYSTFEGADVNQKEIIDLAETMPFFSDRRLIVLEDTGIFQKGGEDLAEYLPESSESTYFIFVEEEVDKRSKIYKALKKIGADIKFERQTSETLGKWVGSRVRKEGKQISNAAFMKFIDKTGTDMENIDKELEKLLCYCMEKSVIEVEDVEAVTTEQLQNKIFDMVDAIAAHDQKKALDFYYDLLALKEPSMRILFLIARQFRILMIVKGMSSQGFSPRDIAAKAGCPDWAVKKYQAQARSYTLDQLKMALKDATSFEEAVKTGQMNDQLAVEVFLMKYSNKKTIG